jgi:ABC-type sugar transport system substrate-binding protein
MQKTLLVISIVLLSAAVVFAGGPKETPTGKETGEKKVAAEEANKMIEPPYVVDFDWGEFKLNPRIASKIENNEPINFVVSCYVLSMIGGAAQINLGLERAAESIKEKYGFTVVPRLVGPVEVNTPEQIEEIQSLIQANQVDVVAFWMADAHSFIEIINRTMENGIPAYAINTDSPDSKRIAYYGSNDSATGNGADIANFAMNWAKENNFTFESVAMTCGDDTGEWAHGRMQAFYDTMKKEMPDIKIYGTYTKAAVVTGFVSTDIYTKTQAFLGGHPDVNFVFNTDWGGVPTAQAITDMGKEGKVYCVAYNVDEKIVTYAGNSPLIATADQNYIAQGQTCLEGAADFLFGGIIPKDPLQYVPVRFVTKESAAEIKKDL